MKIYVAEVRKRRGWTQQQLAELVSMDLSTIGRLEVGLVGWRPRTLALLEAGTRIPQWEWLGYSHPPDEDLPEATSQLVHDVLRLDERGVRMAQAVVDQAAEQGMLLTPRESA